MIHPGKLSIHDFAYILPEEYIAAYPLAERDASRLLIYQHGKITEDIYKNIAEHIPANSLIVFNDTRVIEARILFQKPSGGVIEVFCLEPHEQYKDCTSAMLQTGKVVWHCMIGGASKWKNGQLLEKKINSLQGEILLTAKYVEKRPDSFIIELFWQPAGLSFAEILQSVGAIPLPPYIKRPAESSDAARYQTVYAHAHGSVAAPTAGLHFTNTVFESLRQKNIDKTFVTLHVGAGTFKPVKAETMVLHQMHAEWIDVSAETIEQLLKSIERPIIAAGTTSLRTLESLYWLGVKELTSSRHSDTGNTPLPFSLEQWEAYDIPEQSIPATDALQSLLQWMRKNNRQRLVAKTRIIIAPGYTPRIANALITNFHQPQSTLLLLVAAVTGRHWKDIYGYALENNFRFLSYGDGSLLWFRQE